MPKSDATRAFDPKPEPADALELRRLEATDLDQVLAIERGFNAPWSRDMFVQELQQLGMADNRVASAGSTVLGYVLWWYVADEVHIVNLAVHVAHRRRGIARRLLHEVFELGRSRGMTIATLEVRAQNSPAIGLYESLDFSKVAIRKSYYADNGEDALVMLKSL
jgi:ribosomal-protein-alanine N-acetyltransferase